MVIFFIAGIIFPWIFLVPLMWLGIAGAILLANKWARKTSQLRFGFGKYIFTDTHLEIKTRKKYINIPYSDIIWINTHKVVNRLLDIRHAGSLGYNYLKIFGLTYYTFEIQTKDKKNISFTVLGQSEQKARDILESKVIPNNPH